MSSSRGANNNGRAGSPSYDNYNNGGGSRAGLGLPRFDARSTSGGVSAQQQTPQPVQTQTAWQTTPQPQAAQNSSSSAGTGSSAILLREKLSQSVEQVWLSADVYFVCMTHALTTEKDEICGLLLGQPAENGRRIEVTACFPLPRGTHRQKDRVEITPLQMAMGVEHADALQKSHGMNVRVVGWYHSHPRLMPIPSSVDVRSQEACEQQDATFVGLIFTPFNSASKQAPMTQQLQLLAFKTDRTSSLGFRQLTISLVDLGGRSKSGLGGVSRWALDTLLSLLGVLQSEEDELMSQATSSDEGNGNFLANTSYSYRLMRVMNEIGYPLIAALESRLESSRNETSSRVEYDSAQKHLLDTSPSATLANDQLLQQQSQPQSQRISSGSGTGRTVTPPMAAAPAASATVYVGGSGRPPTGGDQRQRQSTSKTQPLYSQAHFGTNV